MSESDPMAVMESQVPLPRIHQGKVRDVYDAGNNRLLMVASDRVSAFDVILSQPIPRKGEVLTQITAWWLDSLRGVIDHHLLSCDPDEIADRVPSLRDSKDAWARRSMLVHRTEPVLVECVIRGYVSGSAWKEYRLPGRWPENLFPTVWSRVRSYRIRFFLRPPKRRPATTRTFRSRVWWSAWAKRRPIGYVPSPSRYTNTVPRLPRSTGSSLPIRNSSSGTTRTVGFF